METVPVRQELWETSFKTFYQTNPKNFKDPRLNTLREQIILEVGPAITKLLGIEHPNFKGITSSIVNSEDVLTTIFYKDETGSAHSIVMMDESDGDGKFLLFDETGEFEDNFNNILKILKIRINNLYINITGNC